jgi:hypothetical protein
VAPFHGSGGGAGGEPAEEQSDDVAKDARRWHSAARKEVTGSRAERANWLGGPGGVGLAHEKN